MRIWGTWTKIAPTVYAAFFATLYFWHLENETVLIHHWLGIGLTFSGFLFWIIARAQLWQAFAINPNATELVTSGLYAKLKHPIYYFELMAFLGVAIFFWDALVSAIVLFLFAVQIYRMRKENTLLRNTFGEKYERYASSVWF